MGLLAVLPAFFTPLNWTNLKMIAVIKIGPQIITTGRRYFVMVRDSFSKVFSKKSIATFEDKAPKASQGRVQRVKRLPGSSATVDLLDPGL